MFKLHECKASFLQIPIFPVNVFLDVKIWAHGNIFLKENINTGIYNVKGQKLT